MSIPREVLGAMSVVLNCDVQGSNLMTTLLFAWDTRVVSLERLDGDGIRSVKTLVFIVDGKREEFSLEEAAKAIKTRVSEQLASTNRGVLKKGVSNAIGRPISTLAYNLVSVINNMSMGGMGYTLQEAYCALDCVGDMCTDKFNVFINFRLFTQENTYITSFIFKPSMEEAFRSEVRKIALKYDLSTMAQTTMLTTELMHLLRNNHLKKHTFTIVRDDNVYGEDADNLPLRNAMVFCIEPIDTIKPPYHTVPEDMVLQ